MMQIESIEVSVSRLPLPFGNWQDQIHHVEHIELIVVDVRSSDGKVGTGISHTSGVGARGIVGLLSELAVHLPGREVVPQVLWDEAWRYLHDCGGGGVTTLALAALDMACWDLVAKASHLPLADLLGRRREVVPLYGSGINLNLSEEALVEQAREWRARGYKAAKIKVGKESAAEDVERVAAVRAAVPDLALMVDANQGWTLPEATRRMRQLERFDLVWVEEPLLIDDVDAHRQLAREVTVPIALGENVYTIAQFKQFIGAGITSYVQADVARVGGITPYLRIAELAAAHQLPMAPHFIMEISASLCASVRNLYLVEDTAGGTLSELGAIVDEQRVKDGTYVPSTEPGLGVTWNRDVLERFAVRDLSCAFG